MAVREEITSPELVLVSPPEVAAEARAALPDYTVKYAQRVVHARGTAAADPPQDTAEPEELELEPDASVEAWPWYTLERKALDEPSEEGQRLGIGAYAFTFFASLSCLAPLLLLLYHRR